MSRMGGSSFFQEAGSEMGNRYFIFMLPSCIEYKFNFCDGLLMAMMNNVKPFHMENGGFRQNARKVPEERGRRFPVKHYSTRFSFFFLIFSKEAITVIRNASARALSRLLVGTRYATSAPHFSRKR